MECQWPSTLPQGASAAVRWAWSAGRASAKGVAWGSRGWVVLIFLKHVVLFSLDVFLGFRLVYNLFSWVKILHQDVLILF